MSSLGKLTALLQRAPLELTAEDIADALWLAAVTGHVVFRRPPSALDASGAPGPDDQPPPTDPLPPATADPPQPSLSTGHAAIEAVLPTERITTPTVPFRSPAAAAIPDALALGRALRPLRRRVPSLTRAVLNESATATLVADTFGQLWLPVLRPAMSRWLDLELVVEDSPSMRLWSRTIAELELLFQFNGAFRHACPWRLVTDGPIRLFSGRDRSAAARDHRELFDSSGRRAILIVSDCVSPAWYDGTLGTWLAAWAHRGPVAILQVLPQRLWARTALRRGVGAHFSAAIPATPNTRLATKYIAAAPALDEDLIPLPIITLDASSLAAWARTVAGLSGAIQGVALRSHGRTPGGAVTPFASTRPTAAARVALFREASTAPARLLASCLAAVPINLPIVRLVRAAMVPEARNSDIAELFLGGLLREVVSDGDPDRTEYDFHEGVRELLLDFLPTGKALNVLDRVSAYIEPRLGQAHDFPARLTAVSEGGSSFAERHRSFARIALRVFERLGDDWRGQVADLQRQTGAPLPGRDVVATASTSRFFDDKAARYEQVRRQQPDGREPRRAKQNSGPIPVPRNVVRLGVADSLRAEPILLPLDDLKTHMAFLGSTGSGKTTAALSVVEQLLERDVSVVLVDRKGDLARYASEAWWTDASAPEAERARKLTLRKRIDVALFTPGNSHGRPLRLPLVPSLSEAKSQEREQLGRYAADGLAAMMGYGKSTAHRAKTSILQCAILLHGDERDITLDLLRETISRPDPELFNTVGSLQRHFGSLVEDLQTLRIQRGSLLSGDGEPLDLAALLPPPGTGRAKLSIINTSALTEVPLLQFWISRLLIELSRLGRKRPSATLQAAAFFDEADMYIPATSAPPTKDPMFDLLRRSRSVGIAVLLATQNPADLDYKARDNINTWLLGKITQDRATEKMRNLIGSYPDVGPRLASQRTGSFFLLTGTTKRELKADRSLMETVQQSESEVLELARQTRPAPGAATHPRT